MRILLVEDEQNLCFSLSFQLEQEGFLVDVCRNGNDAFEYIYSQIYDFILLDRMLPGMDGISILKKMRSDQINTPVILLTALGQLQDKVYGLDAGADDYLAKPFAFEELMARIRCIIRRPREWNDETTICYGDLVYRPSEHVLCKDTRSCTLSKKEGALMEFLMRHPNQNLQRDMLLNKVWGRNAEIEDGNLDNYIYFLRRRIKTVCSTVTIKTLRGIGYCLEDTNV